MDMQINMDMDIMDTWDNTARGKLILKQRLNQKLKPKLTMHIMVMLLMAIVMATEPMVTRHMDMDMVICMDMVILTILVMDMGLDMSMVFMDTMAIMARGLLSSFE